MGLDRDSHLEILGRDRPRLDLEAFVLRPEAVHLGVASHFLNPLHHCLGVAGVAEPLLH